MIGAHETADVGRIHMYRVTHATNNKRQQITLSLVTDILPHQCWLPTWCMVKVALGPLLPTGAATATAIQAIPRHMPKISELRDREKMLSPSSSFTHDLFLAQLTLVKAGVRSQQTCGGARQGKAVAIVKCVLNRLVNGCECPGASSGAL